MRMVQVSVPLTLGVDGMVKGAMIDFWARKRGGSSMMLLPTWMPPDPSEPDWIRWGDIGVKDPDGGGLADPAELERLFDTSRHAVADLLTGSASALRVRLESQFAAFVARLDELDAGQAGPKEPQQVKRDQRLGELYMQLVGLRGIPDIVNARLR